MKTLINRMALIATGVAVLGSATFRFPLPIHLPCWLELPGHTCRVVPHPLVRTTTGATTVR